MKTYVIGRSQFADIVLPDASVARRHAELVVTEDGRYHLTDCASGNGTRRLFSHREGARVHRVTTSGGQERWTPLRQAFVDADEPLRLGDYRCTAQDLMRQVVPEAEGGTSPSGGRWRLGAALHSGPERLRGPVERDPITGEVIRRRRL